MSCSWELLYIMNDGVNMNDFIDTFSNSFEPFALSHAVNPVLLYLLFLMLIGFLCSQKFDQFNDHMKKSLFLTGYYSSKALRKHLKLCFGYFVFLFAVFFLFFWESFETLIAAFSVTLKIRVPSIANSTNIFSRIINEVWFGDTYTNSILDLIDGLFALLLAVYILRKTHYLLWKPTTFYVFIVNLILLIANFFIQCVCMLYIKLNSCLPTNSTLFSDNFNINTVQIGNIIYMIITIITLLLILWNFTHSMESHQFNKHKHNNFKTAIVYFCIYTFLVCSFTVIIIQSVYIQMWVARLVFCVILVFNENYKVF